MTSSPSLWHCAAQWRGHQGAVYDLAVDAEGSVWSAGGDGLLVKWTSTSPHGEATGEAMARTDQALFCVGVVDDGVVAGGASGGLVHWTPTETRILNGHEGGTLMVQGALSAGADGRLCTWESGAEVLSVPGRIRCCLPDPHADSMWVGTHQGHLYSTSGTVLADAHRGPVRGLMAWPGKPAVASVGGDGAMKLWSTSTEGWTALLSVDAHKGAIYRIAPSPGGEWVATSSRDKSVAIWSASSLQLVARLQGPGMKGHTRSVNALAWIDPDTLVTGGDDRRILLWRRGASVHADPVNGQG